MDVTPTAQTADKNPATSTAESIIAPPTAASIAETAAITATPTAVTAAVAAAAAASTTPSTATTTITNPIAAAANVTLQQSPATVAPAVAATEQPTPQTSAGQIAPIAPLLPKPIIPGVQPATATTGGSTAPKLTVEQVDIEILPVIYDIIRCVEKDPIDNTTKQRESQECNQKIIELQKRFESARAQIRQLPGIDYNKEEQEQKLDLLRNQLRLKYELIKKYKDTEF